MLAVEIKKGRNPRKNEQKQENKEQEMNWRRRRRLLPLRVIGEDWSLLASEEVKERKKRKRTRLRLREKQPLMMALLPIEFDFFVLLHLITLVVTLYTRSIQSIFFCYLLVAQRRVFFKATFLLNFPFPFPFLTRPHRC